MEAASRAWTANTTSLSWTGRTPSGWRLKYSDSTAGSKYISILKMLVVNKVVIMMVITREVFMWVLVVNKMLIMMVLVIAKEVSMMVLLVNKLVIMMVLVINKEVFMMVL